MRRLVRMGILMGIDPAGALSNSFIAGVDRYEIVNKNKSYET